MKAPVSDLAPYWLELTCCGGTNLFPIRLIVTRQGGHHQLGAVLDKLKCKLCGGPPVRAYLNETHNRTTDNHGAPPGWTVQLIPAPFSLAEAAE